MATGHRRIATAVAASALLAGCAPGGGDAAMDPPPPTAVCSPVTFPPVQFGSHLLGDTDPPVPYSSTPPTSGWHTSGAIPEGIFTDPLTEAGQVSVLEAGGVVVTHHDLDPQDLDRLVSAVESGYADRVVVTPYDAIPEGSTAFTSWGAVQTCTGLDLDALDVYALTYAQPIEDHD